MNEKFPPNGERPSIKEVLGEQYSEEKEALVRRSSGKIEGGWHLSHINENGNVVLNKYSEDEQGRRKFDSKSVSREEFLELNSPDADGGDIFNESVPKDRTSEIFGEAKEITPERKEEINELEEPEKVDEEVETEKTSIPLMVTRGMEQQLADLGYPKEERSKLKPTEVWEILNKSKTFKEKKKTSSEGELENFKKFVPGVEEVLHTPEEKEWLELDDEVESLASKEFGPESEITEEKFASKKWEIGKKILLSQTAGVREAGFEDVSKIFAGSTPEEKKEIEKELDEVEKEITSSGITKVFRGLSGLGFWVQEQKGNFFSSIFDKLAEKKREKVDKDNLMLGFLESYSDIYKKVAEKGRADKESLYKTGSGMKHLSGMGTLLGTGAIISRLVLGPGAWWRFATTAALAFGRGGEALKKAELKRESVIEEGRVHDVEEAFIQARILYKEAGGELGSKEKQVSKENLKKIYLEKLPQDILGRLGSAGEISQKIAAYQIRFVVDKIDEKLFKIDYSKELTEDQKKTEKEKILKKSSVFLSEMDRMVSNSGRVDMIAWGGGMAEKIGKSASLFIAVETLSEWAFRGTSAFMELFDGDKDILSEMEAGLSETLTDAGEGTKEEVVSSSDAEIPEAHREVFGPAIPDGFDIPEEAIFGTHTVSRGETLWKIIENSLEEKGYLKDMNEMQRAYIVDSVMDNVRDLPHDKIQEFGITSGNPDLIYPDDSLDMNGIIKNGEIMASNVSRAEGLSDEEISNIKEAIASGKNLPEEEIPDTSGVGEQFPSSEENLVIGRTLEDIETRELSIEKPDEKPKNLSDFEKGGVEEKVSPSPSESGEVESTPIELIEITPAVEKDVEENITKIFGKRFMGIFNKKSGFLSEEWEKIKGENLRSFSSLYPVDLKPTPENKNYLKLSNYIVDLFVESGEKVSPGETVESYIYRATREIFERKDELKK